MDGPNAWPNEHNQSGKIYGGATWVGDPADGYRKSSNYWYAPEAPSWWKHLNEENLIDATARAFKNAAKYVAVNSKGIPVVGIAKSRLDFENEVTEFGRKQEEAFNAFSGKVIGHGNYTDGVYSNTMFDKPPEPDARKSIDERPKRSTALIPYVAAAAIVAQDLGRSRAITISKQLRKKKPKTKNEVIRFYRECRVPWTTIVRILRAFGMLKKRRRYTTGTE